MDKKTTVKDLNTMTIKEIRNLKAKDLENKKSAVEVTTTDKCETNFLE